ncbi:MAG: hypothetical protein HYT22_04015 [Candidatus Niyogibacteria bacterium]|nr:hypothetical protein [Candidatus Niyogibacteria bacterium]
MPKNTDFRSQSQFSTTSLDHSGSFVGRKIYWKLYAIENIYRVLIHSILTAQIGSNWWDIAVNPNIQKKAKEFKDDYSKRPWHTTPGNHFIYYAHLSHLNEIIRVNSHLFIELVPDIEEWMVKVETLRLPRNVVAHMNFPNSTDRARIDVLYEDFKNLLSSSSITSKVILQIP